MKSHLSKIKGIVLVCLVCASAPLLADQGPNDDANPPALKRTATAATATATATAGSTYTYTTCYFMDGSTVNWHWGLNDKNGWFNLTGDWVTTQFTKLTKFKTSEVYDKIFNSCVQTQAYYKIKGNLFAIFAADYNGGSNFPILLGGGELFPVY